ncbi:acetyl-CoA carboxylase carboxyltransferase subunit alpha [Immundisolibacter sp.]|uniref:acetyl-CoA carboxylase carboxyltransferase subunit alpha n=1 Tax=Immundisolibacter sp. TaxID=1934948 RepID=UPI00356A2D1C
MGFQFLEFEKPIAELEARIDQLRQTSGSDTVSLKDDINRLQRKRDSLTDAIFSKLSPVQIAQLARHPERPYTLDYVQRIFSDFEELHGDRMFGDDQAIVGGLARLADRPVLVIGHQKGREVQDKVRRNFGMPKPEGYRKAQRLMRTAARFRLPIITFIDTPGAYPGVDAEERGQSQAIAESLYLMARLPVPIICVVIGEGGSGGALAIGVGDRLLMLKYATYAVISPEGCAAILWKDSGKAEVAAEAMGITAPRLHELGLVDEIIPEPRGGAHRDFDTAATSVRTALLRHLEELSPQSTVGQPATEAATTDAALLARRLERVRGFGIYKEG